MRAGRPGLGETPRASDARSRCGRSRTDLAECGHVAPGPRDPVPCQDNSHGPNRERFPGAALTGAHARGLDELHQLRDELRRPRLIFLRV